MNFSLIIALSGLAVMTYRLQPWRRLGPAATVGSEPRVSIIVPCRNEVLNLPVLLQSLKQLNYGNFEIIVVDDHSTDRTAEVALRSGLANLRVIQAPDRPAEWSGKNWACHAAVEHASGEYLLFTDADTVHRPESMRVAVSYARLVNADLLSAPPFHLCRAPWEKFLASFLIFPLIAGAYRQRPTQQRLFAIGQYLLFTRESYFELGGHTRVLNSLAEDFDLAQRWIAKGKCYRVFPSCEIFEVQMFDGFKNFVTGWRRLLRLGLSRSTLQATLETALTVNTLGFCLFSSDRVALACSVAAIAMLAIHQRQIGRFYRLSYMFAPLGVWLFCVISLLSVTDLVFDRSVVWRGREYKV